MANHRCLPVPGVDKQELLSDWLCVLGSVRNQNFFMQLIGFIQRLFVFGMRSWVGRLADICNLVPRVLCGSEVINCLQMNFQCLEYNE